MPVSDLRGGTRSCAGLHASPDVLASRWIFSRTRCSAESEPSGSAGLGGAGAGDGLK